MRLGSESIRFALEPLKYLEKLNLGDNCLDSKAGISNLVGLTRLSDLILRGNPICNEENYIDDLSKILKKLPCLKTFDSTEYRLELLTSALGAVTTRDDSIVLGAGDDSASCSCLEVRICSKHPKYPLDKVMMLGWTIDSMMVEICFPLVAS